MIVFCETKLPSGNEMKKLFPEYEISTRSTKVGKCGVAIGVRLQTFKSVLDVTTTDLQDILSVRICMESCSIRVILGYAPQETEKIEVRENFFMELDIEVAKCILDGDLPLVIGDLNAKIEMAENEINSITPNGKLLSGIVNNHGLEVLNFSSLCKGKWRTHVIRTTGASSVLDYVMTCCKLAKSVKEMVIDEECIFCPFYTTTKKKIPQYSDHNAMIIKMSIEHSKKKTNPDVSWKITPEGIQNFQDITNSDLRDIESTNKPQKMYNMLENNILKSMDKCFEKRKAKKIFPLKKYFYEMYKKVTAFARKGKAQRIVAKTYIQEINRMNAEATSAIRNEQVKSTLKKLTVDGKFSPDSFYKLCKKSRKQTMMGTSVETDDGTELFGDELILNAYRDEFIHRLRTRDIIPELKNFEMRTEQICKLKLLETKTNKEPDYTTKELEVVLAGLKKGKASGRDKIPPDVLKSCGDKLLSQILTVLNHMKKEGNVAHQWTKMLISTIYKNKGKVKRLVNHRGIFLKQILCKIYGKLNMIRIKDKMNNIDKFQAGGTKNRSTADQTFLIRSAINHSKYMNQCLYITLYDFSQCFDSLWLQDCLLSLWEIGISSEILNIIASLNETCNIIVKTPVGMTNEFQVKHIVQQGSVTGGALCVASTAEVTKEDLGGGAQVGQSNIKALTFVDDIAGTNLSPSNTYQSNERIVWFSIKKRLSLNGPKCLQMCINKKMRDVIPRLTVDGVCLREVEKAPYLGDTFNKLGNSWDLVETRVRKGQCCIVHAMSVCSDVTLGAYAIQTLLLLYQGVFVQVVLNNAQAWSNLNEKQITALQTIQLKYIKRIFFAPSSTPNALAYLETGTLPIEKVIHIRQLVFLHHILTLESDDPVKTNYQEQLKFEYESNWGNEVQDVRIKYGINDSDHEISNMSKDQWKNYVQCRVTSYALNELNIKLKQIKHNELASYEELKPQTYISLLIPVYTRIMFQIRTRVVDLKGVRKYKYEDNVCRLCGDENENINHVVNQCAAVTRTSEIYPFSNDESDMEEIAKRYTEFSRKVEKLNSRNQNVIM